MRYLTAVCAALVLSGVPQACLACGPSFCRPYAYQKTYAAPYVAPVYAPVIATFVEIPLFSVGVLPLSPVIQPVTPAVVPLVPTQTVQPVVPVQPVQAVQPVAAATRPAAQTGPSELAALKARLEALEKENAALRSLAPPQSAPEARDVPLLTLARTKCAACHSEANAEKEGKGFVLLKGDQFATMTDKQVNRLTKKLWSGEMPPKDHATIKPLTDKELALFMDGISQMGPK